MRLGIGLPTHLGAPPDPRLVLDWARLADEAGFAALTVHDRPHHWTWEPLSSLSAAAAVTQRARLMTTAMLLPPRPVELVAKQAAVVDQLSGGRLDLGLTPGARPVDFEALGGPFEQRGARFDRQLGRLGELWAEARGGDGEVSGPAPVQVPGPPLWIGGYTSAAIDRAVRHGAGYMMGAAGSEAMATRFAEVRERAERAGRSLEVAGMAYLAYGGDQRTAEQAEQHLLAYYGTLRRPFEEMVHRGDADSLAEQLDGYRRAGVDLLVLMPTIPELAQLEALAERLLPRVAATA